ncbi:MAG: septum site-determining protein MinC [Eubacteriales bacterium]
MNNHVTIKSSRYGLEVHLDATISFSELLEYTEIKFQEATKFLSKASLAISFEGRVLTRTEEQELIDLITATTGITIICIIDNNKTTEKLYRSIVEQSQQDIDNRDGQFYRGDLKRRQVLESETSVIIIGNVEPGAKVIAKGNIIVMGALKGTAYAGASGDKNAFITALVMKPKTLRIGDIGITRRTIRNTNEDVIEPKIAIVDGEHIYIDPLI